MAIPALDLLMCPQYHAAHGSQSRPDAPLARRSLGEGGAAGFAFKTPSRSAAATFHKVGPTLRGGLRLQDPVAERRGYISRLHALPPAKSSALKTRAAYLLASAILSLLIVSALQAQSPGFDPEAVTRQIALEDRFDQLYRDGKYAEAIPVAVDLLKRMEAEHGPVHEETARWTINAAILFQHLKLYDKAEPLFKNSVKIFEKSLGEKHEDTLRARHMLAALYQAQDEYDTAESIYHYNLKIQQKQLGPEDPETLRTLNNLAALNHSRGNDEEASRLYRQTLSLRYKVLGDIHPDTLKSVHNLATFYREKGELEQAQSLLLPSLETRARKLGKKHAYTLRAARDLESLYEQMGEHAKADELQYRYPPKKKEAEAAVGE